MTSSSPQFSVFMCLGSCVGRCVCRWKMCEGDIRSHPLFLFYLTRRGRISRSNPKLAGTATLVSSLWGLLSAFQGCYYRCHTQLAFTEILDIQTSVSISPELKMCLCHIRFLVWSVWYKDAVPLLTFMIHSLSTPSPSAAFCLGRIFCNHDIILSHSEYAILDFSS